ncbi:MAG TPA: right-handed parallel beta-helix repeat-containing protein, partial [Pyrinomonadaceae bacterium]|nr:right-handed parallel beta-helix repeat-containing protein [Pyrinomonadaceae bacterium]
SDARARGEKTRPQPKGEKSGPGKGDRPVPQGINTWTTNGPDSFATVEDLVIEADTPATLYAATDTGVYKSSDAGATWAQLSNGITTGSFSELAIDPTNNAGAPATVFAANLGTAGARGLYRSTDGGASWALSTAGMPGTGAVSDVAIDPSAPSTVYAGLPDNGIYKSTNGGANWTASTTGITTGATLQGFNDLAVDPLSPQNVYTSVNSTNNGVRGLWKTTDGGANWARIGAATFVSGATALAPRLVFPDPLNAGFVFAATSGTGTSELYRSTDGGANWSASSAGIADKNIRQLARDAAGKLYCLTYTNLYVSTDDGANWTEAPQSGLNDQHLSFATHPADANTTYVGADATGVYKTTDGGASWAWVSEGFQGTTDFYYDVVIDPSNSNTLYAASDSALFKSTDGGQSWQPKSRGLAGGIILSVAVDPADSNKVLAGTGGFGLFRSTDGGETWADVGAGLTDFDNEDVIIDPSNPQIVYVTDSGTGVRRSTDGGLNFGPSGAGIESHQVFDVDFDPTDPTALFAAVANGGATRDGVYKSGDSGATWTRFGGVVSGQRFFSLAIDPTDPRVIYAAGDAAYKTADGGASWTPLNTASASSFESVAVDPSNRMRVYMGNRDGEVYQSADGGQTFALLGAGLPADEIYSMAVSPSGHKVYVTDGGSGVYEYQIVTSGTFIVNSTLDAADSNTGDGLCNDGANNCTLRAAIQQANATAGADSIQFDIPGAGVHTISLAAALPSITEAATVDGYTQPGSSPNTLPVGNNAALRIRLDGQPLHVAASNSTVRGLSFTNSGITLNGASNTTVEGNFVGLDPAGADGNGQGIEIIGGANNQIGTTGAAGRNVISGSAAAGIALDGTTGNLIRNNYVGTNPAGTAAVANATQGILLSQSSNNTVGGTTPAARNVVSGNGGANIQAGGGASAAAGNVVRGNYVGTNAAGTSALGGLV